MTKKLSNPVMASTYGAAKDAGLPESGTLRSSGLSYMSTRRSLQLGAKLRDEVFIQYPLLPEAIFIFQQIVSAREWALGGKPDAVFSALDFINNARSKNLQTGLIDYGFEGFLKRRALDYSLVGRTSFAYNDRESGPYLEYLDPTKLKFNQKRKSKANAGYILPIRPKEKAWTYDKRHYSAEDVMVHHPLPIGSDLFVAPVSWLIPTANLAWLIAEHNAGALDGRKIKDLLLVGSPTLRDSIEQALIKLAQLYDGADVSEVGIPIVEINNMSGTPIKDLFAMVGLSQMPASLDQEKFMFNYANQISGTVGVTLRHFWNDERNTNRALETVQESRQQQKGPAAFIRSEQRLINNSGFLERAAGGKVRFGFIEESDLASLKTKAEVLQAYGEAAISFQTLFGNTLTLPSFMSWMKRIGALPLDIELDDSVEPEEISVDSGAELLEEEELGATGDVAVVGMEKHLALGDVIVDRDGFVIGKRIKIFAMPSIASLVSEKMLKEQEERIAALRKTVEQAELYAEGEDIEEIDNFVEHQLYLRASECLEKLVHGIDELSPSDQTEVKVLHNKVLFNIDLDEKEIDRVDELCKEYEIAMFDLAVEVDI